MAEEKKIPEGWIAEDDIDALRKRREEEEKDFECTPPNQKLREALERLDKEYGYKKPKK